MKIRIVPSGRSAEQSQSSYVVNDRVALDAGCLTSLSTHEQRKIHSVFLSHAHLDHVASLPSFLDNVSSVDSPPVTLYSSAHTRDALQQHIFNGVIWPDLVKLSQAEIQFVRFHDLHDGQTVSVDGDLAVTAVGLKHVVPTYGFIIEDADAAIAIVSDTAPSTRIWESLRSVPNLRAVFLEASFPASLDWLATRSMHLTSRSFVDESQKLASHIPIVAIHLKPAHRDTIIQEIRRSQQPRVEIGEPGKTYQW